MTKLKFEAVTVAGLFSEKVFQPCAQNTCWEGQILDFSQVPYFNRKLVKVLTSPEQNIIV